ncbi:MAG: GDSL-type esterase/lipase family protein [Gemmatimonadota bacterium]|nr:GDSL-type esterase/lipase family protein [Gemmatimonadota bacterium]MDH3421710.1 GDSL-type esterase/lipase family protein [Gemmatimonadota bacterium]
MRSVHFSRIVPLLGVALAVMVASPISAQNTAVTPAPFQQDRHEDFVAEAQQGGIECLLMGDSITDWWRRAGLLVYVEHFEPLSCANFGIAGDRTQGVLWRMQNGELDGYSPKLMMLMIGTNNLSGRTTAPNTPDEIAMGVTAIVTTFRRTFPDAKVLLLGVFPRGADPTNPYREPIRQINELIDDLDDGEYVHFMDIGDRLLEPDGSISVEVMADGLHPTTRGYEIWAEAVMPTFRKLMGAN